MKEGLKCAISVIGVLFVTMVGMTEMQRLPAVSLDMGLKVSLSSVQLHCNVYVLQSWIEYRILHMHDCN